MHRSLRIVVLCVVIHWLVSAIAAPWWVPDVTLVGVVLAVSRSPERWLGAGCLAGLLTMCWVIEWPLTVLFWYVGLGVVLRILSRYYDLTNLRVQLFVIGLAKILWLSLHLWLKQTFSLPLVGLAGFHVVLTMIALALLGRIFAERSSFA